MSWISDLAGKAENILNKIDQNAANVLQLPSRVENVKVENGDTKMEESIIEGLKKNLSSSSLSLTKSLSPKKFLKIDLNARPSEEKINGSNLSSRRNSTSRVDGAEQGTIISENLNSPSLDTKTDEFGTEKELAAMRIALTEIKIERNELEDEISYLRNELKQAKGEQKIREMEVLTRKLSDEKNNLAEELIKLKENYSNQLKLISELETNSSSYRQSIMELTEKLNWQIKGTEEISSELQEYRQKAKSTLQMKDKIIEELKMKSISPNVAENTSEKVLQMELESLRQENLHLNEELSNLVSQVENSKALLQKLEEQLHGKHTDILSLQESLQSSRKMEQQHSTQYESDIRILNQELNVLREEINRERQSFMIQINEKVNEITNLRRQASEVCGLSDVNNIENRMESLTQALVKKQSAIETITAEKNALRLQLEKTGEQLRHLIAQNRQHHNQIIHVNDTDDAKAQLPILMRENPFDTNVARRVKRAYSTLDSAGIRLGVFLRRYPLIRIMVFIYVALLHLWVMFVLLSSTPS